MMGELVGLRADVLAELRTDTVALQPMLDCVHTLPRELRIMNNFMPRPMQTQREHRGGPPATVADRG